MAIEQVKRDSALSKSELHARLRDWLTSTNDAVIGPEDCHARNKWIYIHDAGSEFGLDADTPRSAVEDYLKLVDLYGDDIEWKVVPSNKGFMTGVACGPDQVRPKSFYLYVV